MSLQSTSTLDKHLAPKQKMDTVVTMETGREGRASFWKISTPSGRVCVERFRVQSKLWGKKKKDCPCKDT